MSTIFYKILLNYPRQTLIRKSGSANVVPTIHEEFLLKTAHSVVMLK